MKKLHYFILGILLLASSCKKDDFPKGISTEPEFTSSFSFNGNDYTLSAGEMNLVQSTEYDSLGTGIELSAILSDPECLTCGPAFTLKVQSPVEYVWSSSSDLKTDLEQWNYSINFNEEGNSVLEMLGINLNEHSDGFWFLNGEQVNTNPRDSMFFEISEAGSYSISIMNTQDSCNSTMSRNFVFDGQSIPCYGNIEQNQSEPTVFSADPGISFDLPSTNYTWSYDGLVFGTGSNSTFEFPDTLQIGEICVEMADSEGCVANACMPYSSSLPECAADFQIGFAGLSGGNPIEGIANVIIEFTDENGNTFSSETTGENPSVISLTSISDYTEPTMPDRKLLKAVFEVECLLFDSGGNGYPFNGTLVTAFEYP